MKCLYLLLMSLLLCKGQSFLVEGQNGEKGYSGNASASFYNKDGLKCLTLPDLKNKNAYQIFNQYILSKKYSLVRIYFTYYMKEKQDVKLFSRYYKITPKLRVPFKIIAYNETNKENIIRKEIFLKNLNRNKFKNYAIILFRKYNGSLYEYKRYRFASGDVKTYIYVDTNQENFICLYSFKNQKASKIMRINKQVPTIVYDGIRIQSRLQ